MSIRTFQQRPAFGDVLKQLRLAASLTQEELAEEAGISRLTISALERGVRQVPHQDTLLRLLRALELEGEDRERLQDAARRRGPDSAVPLEGNRTAVQPPTMPPIWGRAQEMNHIREHIEGVGPPLLLLAGEPGIGKTRLLQEAESEGVRHGLRVLTGSAPRQAQRYANEHLSNAVAQHLSQQPPVLRRAILHTLPGLVRLAPEFSTDFTHELSSLCSGEDRRMMQRTVIAFLTTTQHDHGADTSGTLLILDDLQWAHPELLQLLGATLWEAASHADRDAKLRFIVAYRDTEVSPGDPLAIALGDWISGGYATERIVGPLSVEQSEHMLQSLSTDYDAATVPLAGGVPFFICALARHSQQHPHDIPHDLIRVVGARLDTLAPLQRELLMLVRLAADDASLDLLSRALSLPAGSLTRALDALQAARLLTLVEGQPVQFSNPIVERVVDLTTGSATRSVLRARLDAARGVENQA